MRARLPGLSPWSGHQSATRAVCSLSSFVIDGLDRDGDHRAALHVAGVLGLVRHVRATVFHLRDAGVRIMRMGPMIRVGRNVNAFVGGYRLWNATHVRR